MNQGFTLLELIIGFSIVMIIVVAAGLFTQNILSFAPFFKATFETQSEIQQTCQTMTTELRSMSTSNTGSYAIDTASTSTLIFYSDIDEDGLIEKVRYFLDGTNLKKGVIKPSGSPLAYNSFNEVITVSVHNLILPTASSTIFSYYDINYSGSQPAMTFPIVVANIRIIRVIVRGQEKNAGLGTTYTIFATPRNLRSNF